jgi:hypothetical protein
MCGHCRLGPQMTPVSCDIVAAVGRICGGAGAGEQVRMGLGMVEACCLRLDEAARWRRTHATVHATCLKDEGRRGSAPALSDSRLRPCGIIRAVLASPTVGCLCPLTAVCGRFAIPASGSNTGTA